MEPAAFLSRLDYVFGHSFISLHRFVIVCGSSTVSKFSLTGDYLHPLNIARRTFLVVSSLEQHCVEDFMTSGSYIRQRPRLLQY